jgi:hypothetical protein
MWRRGENLCSLGLRHKAKTLRSFGLHQNEKIILQKSHGKR